MMRYFNVISFNLQSKFDFKNCGVKYQIDNYAQNDNYEYSTKNYKEKKINLFFLLVESFNNIIVSFLVTFKV